MGVDISTCVYGGHVVVALRGELDTVDAACAAAAVTAVPPGGECLIVDLSALGLFDCSALGALLGVQRLARQAGGDVLLAAPRERVLRLLALTGLGDVFCVHPGVAAAAASAGGSRARYAARRPAVSAACPGRAAALATGTGVIAAETGLAWQRGEGAGSPAEGHAVSCRDGLPGGCAAGCADD